MWEAYFGIELKQLHLLLLVVEILGHGQPLLLSGLFRGSFLLWCQSVHFLMELLLNKLTVPEESLANGLGHGGHELCILKIIIPVQSYNLLNALVE